jgi:anti-sigma factor RsiW
MDCAQFKQLSEAYIDGELELSRVLELEAHLESCSACKSLAEATIEFRNSVRMNSPRHVAPPELRGKIRAALRRECRPDFGWIRPLARPALYAAAAILVFALGVWARTIISHWRDQGLVAEAVSDHTRSLLADHMLDIASSEQATIERWLIEKLGYSPRIVDLTDKGYKLAGARLETLDNHRVAAIVYKLHDSFINVFVWPATNGAIDFENQTFQGHNLCGWNASGLNHLIVSELDQEDMEKFEDELRERAG